MSARAARIDTNSVDPIGARTVLVECNNCATANFRRSAISSCKYQKNYSSARKNQSIENTCTFVATKSAPIAGRPADRTNEAPLVLQWSVKRPPDEGFETTTSLLLYSHHSGKSVPVLSTVDITGPKNAPQAPRERGMWTGNTFLVNLLSLFSGRINLHKFELILEEWNAMLPTQIARRSA